MPYYESYYSYTDTSTYWWVYLIVTLIEACIFGAITKAINENKGYDGGFWWGFFLGVIGIIVVAVRQPYYTVGYIASRDSFYVAKKTAEKPIDMDAPVPEGGWRCMCGRVHEAYESSCSCGQSKRSVLSNTPTPIDSEPPKIPVTKPQDWTCTCGKEHPSYETSCICGKTKYEVLTANIVLPDPIPEPEPAAVPEPEPIPTPTNEDECIEVLRKYKSLLDDGVITQEDYNAKKKQLLDM